MITPHPDLPPTPPEALTGPRADGGSGPTLRVSVREIREVAFRACAAAGASGGEAATAAELVVLGETLDGDGIRALVEELDRVPRGRVPVARHGVAIDVLHDPADRGPLLLGPLAADLAAAHGRPVLLPRLTWSPTVEWILINAAQRCTVPLIATHIRADGRPGASALATPDGATHRATRLDTAEGGPPLAAPLDTVFSWGETSGNSSGDSSGEPRGEGILLSGWTATAEPADLVTARSPAQQDEYLAAAMRDGLRVNPDLWARACAASRRFLVPEATEAPTT